MERNCKIGSKGRTCGSSSVFGVPHSAVKNGSRFLSPSFRYIVRGFVLHGDTKLKFFFFRWMYHVNNLFLTITMKPNWVWENTIILRNNYLQKSSPPLNICTYIGKSASQNSVTWRDSFIMIVNGAVSRNSKLNKLDF